MSNYRREGFYWMKLKGGDAWIVGEYNPYLKVYTVCGHLDQFKDSDLETVMPNPISNPDEFITTFQFNYKVTPP